MNRELLKKIINEDELGLLTEDHSSNKSISEIRRLMNAQDIIRRVYADQNKGIINNWLREIDKQLSKVINTIGGIIEDLKDD